MREGYFTVKRGTTLAQRLSPVGVGKREGQTQDHPGISYGGGFELGCLWYTVGCPLDTKYPTGYADCG